MLARGGQGLSSADIRSGGGPPLWESVCRVTPSYVSLQIIIDDSTMIVMLHSKAVSDFRAFLDWQVVEQFKWKGRIRDLCTLKEQKLGYPRWRKARHLKRSLIPDDRQ